MKRIFHKCLNKNCKKNQEQKTECNHFKKNFTPNSPKKETKTVRKVGNHYQISFDSNVAKKTSLSIDLSLNDSKNAGKINFIEKIIAECKK